MPRSRSSVRPHAARALPRALQPLADTLAAWPDAVLLTVDRWEDGGAEIVWANPAAVALTGYGERELVGRNSHLLHGVKTELVSGLRRQQGEGWLHRRNGTAFYAAWTFTPVRLGKSPAGYLLGVLRDMSETRRLQEALLHSQKLDTVGQLAGGVAHDFNNLLSIINGYCEIVSAKLAGAPQAQKDLQEIHRAGQKAAGIARQILEFSRRQETEARVVNANTLIREIADILRRVVGERVQVELRLASDLGNMRIDPTQFQQVLLNLCFNARDAMPRGGRFLLRTARAPGTGTGLAATGRVLIQVTDTGVGMAPGVRRRIFEPFYTTKPHGTGLGLSTVLGIVQRAGGTITVESKPGAGTTFELSFPETAESEQIFSTAAPARLPVTAGTERLWIVEADEVLRKMVSGILTVDGYAVTEFARPDAVPAEGAPDLLMLDCGVHEAVAVAGRVRAQNARLRVLSLSVESPAAHLPHFRASAVAHLPKPFTMSMLLRTVRSLLDAPAP